MSEEEKVTEQVDEKPVEELTPVEEAPAVEPKEEAPKEETPAEEPKEETPAEEPKDLGGSEASADEIEPSEKAQLEAPAEEVKEDSGESKDSPTLEDQGDLQEAPAKEPKKKETTEAKDEAPAEETPKKKKAPKKKDLGYERPPLFHKYDISDITITDKGLERYINLNLITIPHVSGRYANKMFGKAKVSIIERLINGMMRTERFTGKKSKTYKVVENSFDIINKRTKENPVQILVQAIENSAPREEITRLRFGGISVPKAVDISPSRRLDLALRNICKGAVKSTHKNKKSVQECLAGEIMAAAKNDMNSFAISKKEEIERVAKSAR